MILVNSEKLISISNALFEKKLVNKSIYSPVVDCLIQTTLRGVDSHGIRLLPHYLKVIDTGRINITPQIKLDQTNKTTAILDADHTFGHYACSIAVNKAIEMASTSGSGFVVVKNSSHNSAGAYYSTQPAKNNMIGISFAHSTQGMIPTNGKNRFLGTNAFSISFPCEGEDPICLDMATTQISWNKVLNHLSNNEKLDDKFAIDKEGDTTDQPRDAIGLLPTGLYKGYGLGLIVEMFCALLANGPFGPHLTDMFDESQLTQKRKLSQFVGAINISNFIDVNIFKKRSMELVNELRSITPKDMEKPVMVAGDPEKKFKKERLKNGIPLTRKTVEEINKLIKLNDIEDKLLI